MKIRLILITTALIGPGSWSTAFGQSSNHSKPDKLRATILYTGQLFGYMRGEGAATDPQCLAGDVPNIDLNEVGWGGEHDILGAKRLPCAIQKGKKEGAVLVGMGNNFSPAYFSRFTSTNQRISRTTVPSKIADDRVGLFLYRAEYDALVPGKDDFYFGAFHLRQVGRLLRKDGHGVMLASNLYLQQEQVADKPLEPRPANFSKLGYVPQRDGITAQFSDEATPWLVSLKFDLDPQKVTMPKEGQLCAPFSEDPDDIRPERHNPPEQAPRCDVWMMWHKEKDSWVPGSIEQDQARHTAKQTFQFIRKMRTERPENHFIAPGNYGFCLLDSSSTARSGTGAKRRSPKQQTQAEKPYCQQLKILEPMFYYDQAGTSQGGQQVPPSAQPPAREYSPYVLVDGNAQGHVAIFGVVDEHLRSYIARENASWEPTDNKHCAFRKPCRTGIHAIAPDAALQQVLEHFSLAYPQFEGIKILLAQMTKAMADELAAHIEDPTTDPDSAIGVSSGIQNEGTHARAFDAVFAKAAQADETPNVFLQVRNAGRRRPAVFVPRPIYDDEKKLAINSLNVLRIERDDTEGIVSFCNSLADDPQETDCRGLSMTVQNEANRAGERQLQNLMPYVATPSPNRGPEPPETKSKEICKDATNDVRGAVCEILTRYDQQLNNNPVPVYDLKWFEKTFQQFTLNALIDSEEVLKLSTASQSASTAKTPRSLSVSGVDVALLQARDFWYGTVENTNVRISDAQELIDRVLWKDDILTKINLSGGQIQKLLDQSAKFTKEEKDASLILPDTPLRAITKGGIVIKKKEGEGDEDHYYSHADDFGATQVYRVATSNHLASGETGYPDAGKPATGKPQVFRSKKAIPISLLVCVALRQWANIDEQSLFERCRPEIIRDEDYRVDASQTLVTATRPAKSRWSRLGTFFANTAPPSNPYREVAAEKKFESYPITEISSDKISVGYTLSSPDTSISNLKNFSGITNTDISQPESSKLDIDQRLRILRRFGWRFDFGFEDRLEYTRQQQDSLTSPTSTSWPRNNFIIGPVLQLRGVTLRGNKYRPHFMYVLRPFQFAIQPAETTFNLSGAASTSALIHQARSYSFGPQFGFRLERDDNSYFETGVQSQHNRNVLSALLLNPGPGQQLCQLSAAQSLAACATNVTLNPNTPPQTQYSRFVQHGMYWDAKLRVPLATKLSYQADTHGDLFANRPLDDENSALARYDVVFGNSLQIPLIGNFSFEPRFEWVFYENKVLGNTLTRRNFSMKLTYSFKRDSRATVWSMMRYDSSGAAPNAGEK